MPDHSSDRSTPQPQSVAGSASEAKSSKPKPPSPSEKRSASNQPKGASSANGTAPVRPKPLVKTPRPESTQVDADVSPKPRIVPDYGNMSAITRNEPVGSMAETLLLGSQSRVSLDLTNCMLGEFRVLRRIGSGGMAQVYLAEQTSLKRNVAIKVMRPDFGDEPTLRARFEHEALAAAGLNHRNIVQVFAIGEQDEVRFIAQEYVLGMNLRQFISKKPPPSGRLAIHLLKQVSAALQAAHEAGIVHRDIKPENIMVTGKYIAKVTDFGLAQLTLGGERVNLTNMGTTMGTPLYMSPEQINATVIDQRSDLYSLGVTFYHLLAGQPPFTAPNAYALASKHLHEQAEPLKLCRPDLPTKLTELIHRLMAKKPDDRFPDAKSVVSELKRIERSLNVGEEDDDDTIDVISAEASGTWLRVPKQQWIAYAIACVIAYALAAGVGRDQRRPDAIFGQGSRSTPAAE